MKSTAASDHTSGANIIGNSKNGKTVFKTFDEYLFINGVVATKEMDQQDRNVLNLDNIDMKKSPQLLTSVVDTAHRSAETPSEMVNEHTSSRTFAQDMGSEKLYFRVHSYRQR